MSGYSVYDDDNIICPYYLCTKGLKIICVKGYGLEFTRKKALEEHKRQHCKRYESACRTRKILDRKW